MKNKLKSALIIFIALILAFSMLFSNDNLITVKIKTSAQCEMCQDRIQKHLIKQNGIEKAELELDSAICSVEYDPTIISLDKIREEISSIGYDADEIQANKRAYKKLPKCCKKPEDR
jgi:copper chaperone CopZ